MEAVLAIVIVFVLLKDTSLFGPPQLGTPPALSGAPGRPPLDNTAAIGGAIGAAGCAAGAAALGAPQAAPGAAAVCGLIGQYVAPYVKKGVVAAAKGVATGAKDVAKGTVYVAKEINNGVGSLAHDAAAGGVAVVSGVKSVLNVRNPFGGGPSLVDKVKAQLQVKVAAQQAKIATAAAKVPTLDIVKATQAAVLAPLQAGPKPPSAAVSSRFQSRLIL